MNMHKTGHFYLIYCTIYLKLDIPMIHVSIQIFCFWKILTVIMTNEHDYLSDLATEIK